MNRLRHRLARLEAIAERATPERTPAVAMLWAVHQKVLATAEGRRLQDELDALVGPPPAGQMGADMVTWLAVLHGPHGDRLCELEAALCGLELAALEVVT